MLVVAVGEFGAGFGAVSFDMGAVPLKGERKVESGEN
jgi:hypothetical protein